jgi:phage-related protein
MKQIYTAFRFGNYTSTANDVLNVTLNNDMYTESVKGSRKIIEDSVQGVEAPYFFYVDDEPLEFSVNFAFEGKTKAEIKTLTRSFLSAESYTPLSFGDIVNSAYVRKSPLYNVVFINQPQISFIGRNIDNTIKYDGYFTLEARCDRPYGFELVNQFTLVNAGTTHNVLADINVYPNILIEVSGVEIENFKLKSVANNDYTGNTLSEIGFSSIAAGETMLIGGEILTISSNQQSTVYSRWNRQNFKMFPGNNYLVVEFTGSATVVVRLDYQAPTFIKE